MSAVWLADIQDRAPTTTKKSPCRKKMNSGYWWTCRLCRADQIQILKHRWKKESKHTGLTARWDKPEALIRKNSNQKEKQIEQTEKDVQKISINTFIISSSPFRSTYSRITSTTSQIWGVTLWESPPPGWRESSPMDLLTGCMKVCLCLFLGVFHKIVFF